MKLRAIHTPQLTTSLKALTKALYVLMNQYWSTPTFPFLLGPTPQCYNIHSKLLHIQTDIYVVLLITSVHVYNAKYLMVNLTEKKRDYRRLLFLR